LLHHRLRALESSSSPPSWEKKYDQGGVILVLNTADGGQKWVKSGIELTHGRPEFNAALHPLLATIGGIQNQDHTALVILLLPKGIEGTSLCR
jgi:hypothetical protein